MRFKRAMGGDIVMVNLLHKLLWDNPNLPEEIQKFSRTIPGVESANQSYSAMLKQVEKQMGYEFSARLEEEFNSYCLSESYAHYLFGLGLRQEILGALLEI